MTTIQRKIYRIVEAIMEGFKTPEMKAQLDGRNIQKAKLASQLSARRLLPRPSIRTWPNSTGTRLPNYLRLSIPTPPAKQPSWNA